MPCRAGHGKRRGAPAGTPGSAAGTRHRGQGSYGSRAGRCRAGKTQEGARVGVGFFYSPPCRQQRRLYLEGLRSVCLKMWQASSHTLYLFIYLFSAWRENVSPAGSGGTPLTRRTPLPFGCCSRSQAPGQGSLRLHRHPDGGRATRPLCPFCGSGSAPGGTQPDTLLVPPQETTLSDSPRRYINSS